MLKSGERPCSFIVSPARSQAVCCEASPGPVHHLFLTLSAGFTKTKTCSGSQVLLSISEVWDENGTKARRKWQEGEGTFRLGTGLLRLSLPLLFSDRKYVHMYEHVHVCVHLCVCMHVLGTLGME